MITHRIIKLNDRRIIYIYEGAPRADEQQASDKFIGVAYNMSLRAIKQLSNCSSNTARLFETIYGSINSGNIEKICASYKSVVARIWKDLKIRRENVFIDEEGNAVETVLAGADIENGVVILYDAFFKPAEGDENGLNSRGSIILHEIAHLTGLEKDCETDSLASAECLRNFTLLVCEIVKPEDLFAGKSESELKKEPELGGENGELPNNPNWPDQPRAPEGTPQGGQWVANGEVGNNKDKKANSKKQPYEHTNPKMSKAMREKIEAGRYFTYDEAKKFIDETLDTMERDIGNGQGIINSEDAKALLLRTAIAESELVPRSQEGGGPAKGLMQMEKETFDDFWDSYLESNSKFPGSNMTKKEVKEWIKDAMTPAGGKISHDNLNDNDDLAVVMARIKYISKQGAMPKANDLAGQAQYYAKNYYGGGKQLDRANKFVDKYKKFSKNSKNND